MVESERRRKKSPPSIRGETGMLARSTASAYSVNGSGQ